MKTIITFLTFVSFSFPGLFAQVLLPKQITPEKIEQLNQTDKDFYSHLQGQSLAITIDNAWRIIGESSYKSTPREPKDSSAYVYSGSNDADWVSRISYNWDSLLWKKSTKEDRLSDSLGNLTMRVYYKWNTVSWDKDKRFKYVYDARKNISRVIFEVWKGASWEKSSRFVYTYDPSNRSLGFTYDKWKGASWEKSLRVTNTYDANGNHSSLTVEVWNGAMWEKNTRNIYSYNSSDILLNVIVEYWYSTGWEQRYRTIYSYDNNHNLANETEERWKGTEWVKNQRYIYTYDQFNNLIRMNSENWDGMLWVLDLWVNYYYEEYVNHSVNVMNEIKLSVYPNPANQILMISFSHPFTHPIEVRILDLNGTTVYYDKTKAQVYTINISSLASGVYNYELTQGRQRTSGQFVKY